MRPAESPRKSIEVLRWLRWLLPAALLVVSSSPLPAGSGHEVIAIDADSIDSGPLSVADAVDRVLRERREPAGKA